MVGPNNYYRGAIKKVPACCRKRAVKRRSLWPLYSQRRVVPPDHRYTRLWTAKCDPVTPTYHSQGSQLLHQPPRVWVECEPQRPESCRTWSAQVGSSLA